MTHTLKIELLSPLSSSGGGDWANVVDSDIARDTSGLPYLPARRLKGLLRDGARELVDALVQCRILDADAGETLVADLFGQKGTGLNGVSAIAIGDAYPDGFAAADPARRNLEMLLACKAIGAEEVTGVMTRVRAQTSIEPRSGAAKENSLRFVRVLDQGYVLKAPITLREGRFTDALALAAATVKKMGLSRTRGYGEVRFCLLDDKGKNLTETALQKATSGLGSVLSAEAGEKTSAPAEEALAAATPGNGPGEFHFLRYRIEFLADVLLPQADTDPNTVTSSTHVQGSTLLGAFASVILSSDKGGCTPDHVVFRRLFLSGDVRFLNAYPEAMDEEKKRLMPAPHSLREKKDGGLVVNLACNGSQRTPVKRIEGRFLKVGHDPKSQDVATNLHYHHARTADRRFGRALGDEVQDGGAMFTYESVAAGQKFIGALLGSQADLAALREICEGKTIMLGRSRSAQYGGRAKIIFLDEVPGECKADKPEWNSWNQLPAPPNTVDKELLVTCLSPLLAVNEHGHPAAVFPLEELAEKIRKGNVADILVSNGSWARTRTVGGFHQHLRLPAQQWPAIAEGSVFRFLLKDGITISPELRARLEQEGLGLRREAGFGRIAVNLHGNKGMYPLTGNLPPIATPVATTKISLQSTDPLASLLVGIVKERADKWLRGEAARFAREAANIPTSSALGRVSMLLRRNDWQTAAPDAIKNFKDRIKGQTKACYVKDPLAQQQVISLWKLFNDWLADPTAKGRKAFEEKVITGGAGSLSQFIDTTPLATLCPAAVKQELARNFLLSLCGELSRQNRKSKGVKPHAKQRT